MTIDGIPESYSGLEYTRAAAVARAAELQAQGRITSIEESLFYPGCYVVHATPKLPDTSTPVEVGLVENVQAPIEDIAPLDLSDNTNLLQTYRSKTEAESAAETFRAEGRATKVVESTLHKNRWVVYCTSLPEDSDK